MPEIKGYLIPDYFQHEIERIAHIYLECPALYAENMMKAHRYAFLANIMLHARGIIQ